MSAVTTHVLDSSQGRPGVGISVVLEAVGEQVRVLAAGVTDADGRIAELGPATLAPGTYRLIFDTGTYFASASIKTFFPQVEIAFSIADANQHYHVPLLLSPFAYSTYRGS